MEFRTDAYKKKETEKLHSITYVRISQWPNNFHWNEFYHISIQRKFFLLHFCIHYERWRSFKWCSILNWNNFKMHSQLSTNFWDFYLLCRFPRKKLKRFMNIRVQVEIFVWFDPPREQNHYFYRKPTWSDDFVSAQGQSGF